MKKTNCYSTYLNEPGYTGSPECIADQLPVRGAIKALYQARKKYLKDRDNNCSHGYIIWDNGPEEQENMVFNMHFDAKNTMPNWQILREIKLNRQ